MNWQQQKRDTQAAAYADAVIDTLAGDFPDLNDPIMADTVRTCMRAYMHTGHLEVIMDDPYLARWRLTADRDHPGRVRIGCWHTPPLSDSVREREARINAALAAIGTETQR